MELTYSQDLIIRDPMLMATLGVFCRKTYLPYHGVADDVRAAADGTDPSIVETIDTSLANDAEIEQVERWKEANSLLFSEGILEFLPAHRPQERRHRDVSEVEAKLSEIDEVYPNFSKRGLFERLALKHHLMRDDLPGTEFFECERTATEVNLAKSVMFIEAPKIEANAEQICQLRETAQKGGIEEFWQLIEQQTIYADGADESFITRAEKIRAEYSQWWKESMSIRGKNLGVLKLVTLCFVNSIVTPIATIAGASWIGEVNRKWAERKTVKNQAFKFISKMDGAIQRASK